MNAIEMVSSNLYPQHGSDDCGLFALVLSEQKVNLFKKNIYFFLKKQKNKKIYDYNNNA
jgi:hypothetical protein